MLRKLRNKMGLSARVLAKLIGSNLPSIYNIEKGINKSFANPDIMKRVKVLSKIFEAIKYNPDIVFNILRHIRRINRKK